MALLTNEGQLLGAIRELIGQHANLSQEENELLSVATSERVSPQTLYELRSRIEDGEDPLGSSFCKLRSPVTRRATGATYTPPLLVEAITRWAAEEHAQPCRVVDPGAGSGRFLMAAGRLFPVSQLIAVETDPLAALMLRANAAVLGFDRRLRVEIKDFRCFSLGEERGTTLFIGNPPYVRHHGISKVWKEWFASAAKASGLKPSKLAGLHIHFFCRPCCLQNLEIMGRI